VPAATQRLAVLRTVPDIRAAVAAPRAAGGRIGFVPTMGGLHAGHASLMCRARAECDFVVVSIFVNPAQFGPREDYTKYPRDLDADSALCKRECADVVFAPEVEAIYPPGDKTRVEVAGLTDGMCGAFRPGHFRGVTTVCARLFNIVLPDAAYFGEKDYQQLKVVERMVADLQMPLAIIPCPTVRDDDGLALSSRNAYLSPSDRQAALTLWRALQTAQAAVTRGARDAAAILKVVHGTFTAEPAARLQYAELRNPETLQSVERIDGPTLLALAAFVGEVRLIDNLVLQPDA